MAEPNGMPAKESQEVAVSVTKQTVYSSFLLADPMPIEGGGMQLNFYSPDGHLQSFPLTEEQVKTLGRKLLAPRVSVADRVPPEVKQQMKAEGKT